MAEVNRGSRIEIEPKTADRGDLLVVRGEGWVDCTIHLTIDDRAFDDLRIVEGYPAIGGFRPSTTGGFVLMLQTSRLAPGPHELEFRSYCEGKPVRIRESIEIAVSVEVEGMTPEAALETDTVSSATAVPRSFHHFPARHEGRIKRRQKTS